MMKKFILWFKFWELEDIILVVKIELFVNIIFFWKCINSEKEMLFWWWLGVKLLRGRIFCCNGVVVSDDNGNILKV